MSASDVIEATITGQLVCWVPAAQGSLGARGVAWCDEGGRYRYVLTRRTGPSCCPTIAVVGMNPSTADADDDDPTITRCLGFVQREGYGRMFMLNAFAERSTNPKLLRTSDGPVGPANDAVLSIVLGNVDAILCCWGALIRPYPERQRRVTELVKAAGQPLLCLGTTNRGHPLHPLYLANARRFRPWEPA